MKILAIDFGNAGGAVVREDDKVIDYLKWNKKKTEYCFDFYQKIGDELIKLITDNKVTDVIYYDSFVRFPKTARNLFLMTGWVISALINSKSEFTLHEGTLDSAVRNRLGLKVARTREQVGIDKSGKVKFKYKVYDDFGRLISTKRAYHIEYDNKYRVQMHDKGEDVIDAEMLSKYLEQDMEK